MEEFVTMPDGARLWTTTCGRGPALAVLNGGPGMADYLSPVASILEDRHTVYRYEQRGCGRSDRGCLTLKQFTDDIDALRRHWKHERWTVLGHSWGVDLALAYTLAHRENVIALIALSGGRVHDDRSWHAIYSENRHREEQPPAASPYSAEVNLALNAEWKAFCRRPTLLADLAELDVPALFLFGEHDIWPSWPTEQIAALMPRASLQVLSHADHLLWNGNPVGMRNAIFAFLADEPSD